METGLIALDDCYSDLALSMRGDLDEVLGFLGNRCSGFHQSQSCLGFGAEVSETDVTVDVGQSLLN
ncbi:MAG: hypothetical protein VYA34_05990 [Myxococcota bacterium]|nr:hypothetical protein [Myxococcota bacterium]